MALLDKVQNKLRIKNGKKNPLPPQHKVRSPRGCCNTYGEPGGNPIKEALKRLC